MRPYDVVEHYELGKNDGLEVLAHVDLDGTLRQVEIIDGSDCITIDLPDKAPRLEGLVEVLGDLLLRKRHDLSELDVNGCLATCPEHPSWCCERTRGHDGAHESGGRQWNDGGAP